MEVFMSEGPWCLQYALKWISKNSNNNSHSDSNKTYIYKEIKQMGQKKIQSVNLGKGIQVLIILFLQLFCSFAVFQNKKVKEIPQAAVPWIDWREQSRRLVQARQKSGLDKAFDNGHEETPMQLTYVSEVKEWGWGMKRQRYQIYICHCHKSICQFLSGWSISIILSFNILRSSFKSP